MTQQHGKIATWKDDRGFGFITPDHSKEEIFFHISNVVQGRSQIAEQTPVFYTLTYDDRKRPQAIHIYVGNEWLVPLAISIIVVVFFFLIFEAISMLFHLPFWLLVGYLALSGVTFLAYARDKSAAVAGTQRIREASLHVLELSGGWPGALIAQQYFRHKNRKTSYQIRFWVYVALNLCALVSVIALSLVNK